MAEKRRSETVRPKKTRAGSFADRDPDADIGPEGGQHLLDQFPRPVPGRRHEFERQRPAFRIAAHAVGTRHKPRLVQQRPCRRRIVWRARRLGIIDPVQGRDIAVGNRLLALKQLLDQGFPVDRQQQGTPDASVLKQRIVQIEVDMLVEQARLEDHRKAVLQSRLQRQGLVQGDAAFSRDHVDIAGLEAGLDGGRVFDHAHHDAAEMGCIAVPSLVGDEDRVHARFLLHDPVRPK